MVNAYTHFDGGLDDICFCEDNNRLFWPFWFDCFYYISVCLRVFNSSINFVIYCFAGQEFRNLFCRILYSRNENLPDLNQVQVQGNQATI